ncbi:hypothetical protein V8V88_12970 [Paenibacillus phytohabitans]
MTYSYGFAFAGNDTSKHDEAVAIAPEADIVILALGGTHGWGTYCTTGEGIDAIKYSLAGVPGKLHS